MEAMTQEFMLHRRPHVEIWSAREGSDDDTSKIHLSNTPLTDPKQCQQRTKDPPQKPKFDGSQQTMVHLRYHKTEINHNHKPLQSSTSETKIWHSSTSPHVHLVHIRNITCCFSKKQLTASNTHLRTRTNMNQTQVFFPGSDYTSYQE